MGLEGSCIYKRLRDTVGGGDEGEVLWDIDEGSSNADDMKGGNNKDDEGELLEHVSGGDGNLLELWNAKCVYWMMFDLTKPWEDVLKGVYEIGMDAK